MEALRSPLLAASRDGFAAIASVPKLGASLRAACDRLLAVLDEDSAEPMRAWRTAIERFEGLEEDQQAIEVARGLRLCQSLGGRARSAPPRPEVAAVGLAAGTDSLSGIGPAMAGRLAERGLCTVEDLLWLVPRRYDDVRAVSDLDAALAAAQPGERVTAHAQVRSCRLVGGGRRRWLDVRVASASGASLVIRWFNAHFSMAKRFPPGSEISFSGRLVMRGGAAEMANPDVLAVKMPDGAVRDAPARIIPRYPDVPGVPPATLRKACAAAVAHAHLLSDPVPADIARRLELPPLSEAISVLHAPPESLSEAAVAELDGGVSRWHRRLAFDELFALAIAIADKRRRQRADRAVPCPVLPPSDVERALPFSLTAGQRRALAAISADLAREVPMNRLLQGDVGSGKTAVAFAAAAQAVAAGRQVALMAPTEILAEQHRATLEPWCRALGIRTAFLTASTPRPVRASATSLLGAGEIDLAIGTHALIASSLEFSCLGLVIIDEQHRFGVAQRAGLRGKGQGAVPHLLVMTATPIPRTLALTVYGDLDVALIDELPAGRTPPRTTVVSGARGRETVYRRLGERVAAGERAFVVCPLVEPAEEDAGRDWRDATTTATELAARLPAARVGLVHGRIAAAERDRVMAGFRDGTIDILVGTTVIEVGVDVPDATVMIIEDAPHFGLSSLHQLRGRVGRGGKEAHCILLARGAQADDAARRLAIMAETTDGFRIAEEDLRIRGPGEVLGVRQAGIPRLRFGDLAGQLELLSRAREEAERLLSDSPDLSRPEDAGIRRALERRAGEIYGAEGG